MLESYLLITTMNATGSNNLDDGCSYQLETSWSRKLHKFFKVKGSTAAASAVTKLLIMAISIVQERRVVGSEALYCKKRVNALLLFSYTISDDSTMT